MLTLSLIQRKKTKFKYIDKSKKKQYGSNVESKIVTELVILNFTALKIHIVTQMFNTYMLHEHF